MDFELRRREREGVVIYDLKGRLIGGEPVQLLRETLSQAVQAGTRSIILNLAETDYIDSSGLGALVIAYTTLKKQGGALKLLNLSKRDIELLVVTKLATIFEVFDDEQSAVNSFFPNREIKRFDILAFVQQQKGS
ncbi:MAG: STAS domain-containing protein [Bryobacteraceae bacterium]|nr:STAS domain-containing protein [Bryobacteraceae bacterium]MDW8378332.1 STAS domain-containing protein [Bryobacterales bacterium]